MNANFSVTGIVRAVSSTNDALEDVLPSLFGTKLDFLWHALDLAGVLDEVTWSLRYYDGYHFLAALGDLRVTSKDTRPQVSVNVIEQVLELFMASIEGIVAQLAWAVEISGRPDLAEPIRPALIAVRPSENFATPNITDLEKVLRVRSTDDEWEVYTVGIPGKETHDRFCYHHKDDVHKM